MKTIKAWAFLGDGEKGKYFITEMRGMAPGADIYLSKPKPRPNPFEYSKKPKMTWQPTEIEIIIK